MTLENISRSTAMKECCWAQRELKLRPPDHQLGASDRATEAAGLVNQFNFTTLGNFSADDKLTIFLIFPENRL